MKRPNYYIEFELSDDECFSKENHDLVMKLINSRHAEIERRYEDILINSPVSVKYSDVVDIFIFILKTNILMDALGDVFKVRKKYNLDETIKEYISDTSFNHAMCDGKFEEAFATVLEHMNYESVYDKMLGIDFAINLLSEI
ncbi:MAG: hypothetical protein IJ809_02075 [Clostridia bacterium]|nr:hypothetical protein [Clostridia bacterium]